MSPCPSCQFPQIGNETFCSNCGKRVFGVARALPAPREHRFYTWIAIGAAVIVFAGFARSYYLRALFHRPPLSLLLHSHGLVMTSWFVVFFVQVRLVAAHRIDLHRRFGLLGGLLAVLILAMGAAVALRAARRDYLAHPASSQPLVVLGEQFGILLVFAAFVGMALLLRRHGAIHKRLMVLACIRLLVNAILRIPLGLIQNGGIPVIIVLDILCALIVVAVDTVRNRRLHPAFGWGGLLLVASDPLLVLLASTPPWIRLATRLVS